MSRYIDAEPLENRSPKLKALIKEQPTVDAVEVIRCKNCKYKVVTEEDEYNPEDIVCSYWQSDGLTENDFCSQGKENKNE